MSTLEDVLNEEVVEPVEEVTEEVETPDETVSEEETTEPEGVEEGEPPAPETSKEVPLAAMLDERDKRKALQAEVESLKAQQNKAEEEKVDFWENPEGAVQKMINTTRDELNQQYSSGYIALSMQYSKTFHDDFDDAKEAFVKAAEENPLLADQALQSEMPGEYIYKTGREFLELSKYGDVETMREKIRLEEREKLMTELSKKEDKLKAVPTPLTDETSATAPREKVEGGQTPLGNIFRHNSG